MTTTDRPDAPLIPATAELLAKGEEHRGVRATWEGPALLDWGPGRAVRHTRVLVACMAHNNPGCVSVVNRASGERLDVAPSLLLLDLRRPEVQDRVSRVWWGASGVELKRFTDGAALCLYTRGAVADSVARQCTSTVRHVPALDSLPDTDTLAWALWECWRAMEVARGE